MTKKAMNIELTLHNSERIHQSMREPIWHKYRFKKGHLVQKCVTSRKFTFFVTYWVGVKIT